MATLSDFTNKDKFRNLILEIDRDITSETASRVLINNQMMQLSGKTITPKVATSTTGLKPLDKIANTIGQVADSGKSSIKVALEEGASAFGIDRPTVVNLSAQGPLNSSLLGAKKITDYLPPTNLALTAFDKLGKDIDGLIKDSLIVQMFHLKGTEILCTTLCLLMSLLPCKLTNEIVDGLEGLKEAQSDFNSGIQSSKSAGNFALGELNTSLSGGLTGLANIGDIKNSFNTAFKINKGNGTKSEQTVQTIKSVTAQFGTLVQLINLLVSVCKIGWTDPKAILGFLVNGMFDLLENVLMALQSMAVQMADKIMNKVIAPIEKFFRKTPELCGIGAQFLFRKILAIIYQFKNKILQFIADLFAFQKGARTKFTLFNTNMMWTLELSALLKVLELLLDNFLDIALSCGVARRQCSEDGTGPDLSKIYQGNADFSEDGIYYNNPLGQNVIDIIDLPPKGTINQLAIKMQPMVDSIFPGTNNQVAVGEVRTEVKDMPNLISQLLGDINLGPNMTIYKNDSEATIVYNNIALCGAN